MRHKRNRSVSAHAVSAREELGRLSRDGQLVGSGVYSAVDEQITVHMSPSGEYEYGGLHEISEDTARRVLAVSAFASGVPNEETVAADLYGGQSAIKHDSIAGYYLSTYAGWVEQDGFRESASSGGLTSWLLVELLRGGHVDAVVHMKRGGANGALFSYQVSRNVEQVRDGAKTRYYPGELSSALREILEQPGRYAVVGIPSFIYELRLLQRLEPVYRDRITFLVGLICGHQKSANYTNFLAWQAGIRPGTLNSIDYRKKIEGVPANQYSTEFSVVTDGVEKRKVLRQSQLEGTDWGLGLFKSHFSDLSQDPLNETADIVLGDAWLPEYTADSMGTNVIIVRDHRVKQILESGVYRGALHLEHVGVDRVIRSQRSLVRQSVDELPYRFKIFQNRGEQMPAIRRMSNGRLRRIRRITQRLRVRASSRSHAAFQAAVACDDFSVFERRLRPTYVSYRAAQLADRIPKELRRDPREVLRKARRKLVS